jgi:hypothetical protein
MTPSAAIWNLERTSRLQYDIALRQTAGRSGKTNSIVIEAKMRAGRRRKLFRQETGGRKTAYAGVSVISMTSAKTFADEKQIF